MKTSLKTMFLLLTAITAGLFTACNNDDDIVNKEGKGTVSFLLTDAPFPNDLVSEANITIDRIEIRKAGDSENPDSDKFIILKEFDEDVTVNLLDLRNGVTAELNQSELESGDYDEIRLHIVNADIVLADGTIFDLKVPSGSSSGLKIKIDGGLTVVYGGFATVLMDFDVSRSFVLKGNANTPAGIKGFNFKPVIRATVMDNTGSIAGTVTTDGDPFNGATVAIMNNGDTLTTAMSDETGYYEVMGLPAGSYTVSCLVADYSNMEQLADVTAGNTTTVDFTFVTPGNIKGIVTAAADGATLNNIIVKLYQNTDSIFAETTDADGYYEFTGLVPDTYSVQVDSAGSVYELFMDDVIVAPADTSTVDISLVAKP